MRIASWMIGVVIVAAAGVRAESANQVRWHGLADMPVGVFVAAASRTANTVVVTGGITQGGTASDLVQSLDLKSGMWTAALRLKHGRRAHAQVTLADGRILVVGGETGTRPGEFDATTSCELIDLSANRVDEVEPLGKPAKRPTAHLLSDGRVVVIAGKAASVFDPASCRWVKQISLHHSRKGHASVLLPGSDRVLIVGGMRSASMEVVDMRAGDSILLEASLPTRMDDMPVVALDTDRAIVLGGQDSQTGRTTDRTWIVDLAGLGEPAEPGRGSVTDGPRLGITGGVADHVAIRIGRWIVIAGGETEQGGRDRELATSRLLDCETMAVWSLPPMMVAHDDAVAVRVDQSALVIGGYRVGTPGLIGVWTGARAPIAVRQVERLELPTAAAGQDGSSR